MFSFLSDAWWTGIGSIASIIAMGLAVWSTRQARNQAREFANTLLKPELRVVESYEATRAIMSNKLQLDYVHPGRSTEFHIWIVVYNVGIGPALNVSYRLTSTTDNNKRFTGIYEVRTELLSRDYHVLRFRDGHIEEKKSHAIPAERLLLEIEYSDLYGTPYKTVAELCYSAIGEQPVLKKQWSLGTLTKKNCRQKVLE